MSTDNTAGVLNPPVKLAPRLGAPARSVTKQDLSSLIQRQLTMHGYDVARGAAEDVAAQILQAQIDPLTQLLDAALAVRVSLVIWGSDCPNAEETIREWCAANAGAAEMSESTATNAIYVDRRGFTGSVVTFYRGGPEDEDRLARVAQVGGVQ